MLIFYFAFYELETGLTRYKLEPVTLIYRNRPMVGLRSPKPHISVRVGVPVPPRVGLIGNWLCPINITSLFEDKRVNSDADKSPRTTLGI